MVLMTLLFAGCASENTKEAAPSVGAPVPAAPRSSSGTAAPSTWLKGSVDERFATVARQLRGFDMAMVETGYRYIELYWAAKDENWDYAAYQVEKIRTAVAHGVERRPKRAKSAAMLDAGMNAIDEAIEARDGALFAKSFAALTTICNACHEAEEVSFVTIATPTERQSPVRALPAASEGAKL